mgnify:CR=1 FL=1
MNAVILAGGKGSRLAPFVAPKSLLPINGVPIIQRILKHLLVKHSVFERAIICTGYRAADVRAAVAEHNWGTRVAFSDAGEDATMGERLSRFKGERIVVVYGDELADVDLVKLLERHGGYGRAMTFTVAEQAVPGGVVDWGGGVVKIAEDTKSTVNIGFVVVEPDAWKHLEEKDGLWAWINRMSSREPAGVGTYLHTGLRATVNSLIDLKSAEEMWR